MEKNLKANVCQLYAIFLPEELVAQEIGCSGGYNTGLLRQQESAYFQLHEVWSLHAIRPLRLGLTNALRGWKAHWATRKMDKSETSWVCGSSFFTKVALLFLIVTVVSLCIGVGHGPDIT